MRILVTVLAIASGVTVLAGYFLAGAVPVLDQARFILTDWAVILAGMAALIGVANLVFVHIEKVRSQPGTSLYSAVLIIALFGTTLYGVIAGPEDSFLNFAVTAIVIPVEASLLALLAVTLVYACIRLARRRADVMSVIFLVTIVLFLLAVMPTPIGPIPVLDRLILGMTGVVSGAGARGLLIGVALGTLLTGLRVLLGIDRPYGGN
ncbi:MAG: hypothetical protein HXY42_12495 [Chloroflexi bacterium]|nr:hypothetical protein [Chloroflexota bacterium]